MAALVSVHDFRFPIFHDGLFNGIDEGIGRQAVRQAPGQYPASCPIKDGAQIAETLTPRSDFERALGWCDPGPVTLLGAWHWRNEHVAATGTAEREAATVMAARCAKGAGCDDDERTTWHAGCGVSLRLRNRIEEILGRAKTVGGLRKTCFNGLAKVKAQTTFTLAAYNLTRMATIFSWRLNTVEGAIRPEGCQMAT